GVDMGGTEKIYSAISEVGGNIIDEVEMDRKGLSGEECYHLLIKLIDKRLASPALKDRKVRGIGVGAPGITHQYAGCQNHPRSNRRIHWPLCDKRKRHDGRRDIGGNSTCFDRTDISTVQRHDRRRSQRIIQDEQQ
ncbi:MAG: hypothetical protein ABI986_10425, partial [Chloroflexota bacterium]